MARRRTLVGGIGPPEQQTMQSGTISVNICKVGALGWRVVGFSTTSEYERLNPSRRCTPQGPHIVNGCSLTPPPSFQASLPWPQLPLGVR